MKEVNKRIIMDREERRYEIVIQRKKNTKGIRKEGKKQK
jgi:hypothetical protein